MAKKTGQKVSAEKKLGQVTIDGHSYPADPASEEFTNLLMDCFQRGRGAAAARQRKMALKPVGPKKKLPVVIDAQQPIGETMQYLKIDVQPIGSHFFMMNAKGFQPAISSASKSKSKLKPKLKHA